MSFRQKNVMECSLFHFYRSSWIIHSKNISFINLPVSYLRDHGKRYSKLKTDLSPNLLQNKFRSRFDHTRLTAFDYMKVNQKYFWRILTHNPH